MRKWNSLVLGLALLSTLNAGCFRRSANFDPPPFQSVELNTLPKRVEEAFRENYPTATIQRVDSRTWPTTDEDHFRIIFSMDGELMETQYREGGIEMQNALRILPADDTEDDQQP